jgi:hypothetical protein
MVLHSIFRFQRGIGRSLRAARRNSWLAAVSLVAVYLVGVGHVVFVPHVLCEHGELTHARPLDPASLAERAFESPVSAIASAARAAGLTSPEGHQHCLVCTNRRDQLSQLSGAFAPCSTVIGLREPQSDGIAPVCLAVLQFAPKQSPPA